MTLPSNSSYHLSDDQLAECLSDCAPASAVQHLASCALCRDELEILRSSLADFNDLSLAWAADRAPARIPVPSRSALRWYGAPVWSALAAVLTAAVFLTAVHEHTRHAQTVTTASAAPQIASQIASSSPEDDDRLLLAVDQELRISQQSPVSASELGLPHRGSAQNTDRSLEN